MPTPLAAPPLGWLRKFGTVAANHENARSALESGAALLVYPDRRDYLAVALSDYVRAKKIPGR